MDPVINTPRLKLTFLKEAKRGSQELAWLHELRSDPQSTWWSIHRRSESLEDTERVIQNFMPSYSDGEDLDRKSVRIAYAVHKILESEPSSSRPGHDVEIVQNVEVAPKTQLIGLVSIHPLTSKALAIPTNMIPSPAEAATTNTMQCEIAYMFLPRGWGQGYATEAVAAVLSACKRVPRSYWAPFDKMFLRSIVNEDNPKSLRVMQKAGLELKGVYDWSGEPIWLAGGWRTTSRLCIFGLDIVS